MKTIAGIIARKRDGHALSRDDIAAIVRGYTDGGVPDYQMAAWAMAVYIRGMDAAETAALTKEMLGSGTTLCWPEGFPPRVDKHSTGGVGDKVSLVLAPLLACCDLKVPMISGRGLGPSGGTLDKLEAIPGFRTDLSTDEVVELTGRVGCVITGATADLAPADKKLYALRDVTSTVSSIPLITASILSKKLAEGLDALVLDVKFGSGAFMSSLDRARQLAETMVAVGTQLGLKVTALLTDMNQPLGRMVGNAVEVSESVKTLEGNGPADLRDLVIALGAELLVSSGQAQTLELAQTRLIDLIETGCALEKYREMVTAQGGNADAELEVAPGQEVKCPSDGFVTRMDTEKLGEVVIDLGGGRRVMTDSIDHAVGLEMMVRLGDQVQMNQSLVRIFGRPGMADKVTSQIEAAIGIDTEKPQRVPLIFDKVAG